MKTILVPTDFSPAANAATKFAISLAKQFKSQVILLHVIEGVDEGSFNVEGETSAASSWDDRLFNLKMIQKSKKQLAEATEAVTNSGVPILSILRIGNAYHGIQSIITEQEADLVVMGTEGATGVRELVVGSTTEKVVRRSACPVISVNRDSVIRPIKSIVWSTALRDEDLDLPVVLRKVMELPEVTVHLVRINTPALFISDTIAMARLAGYAEKMKMANFTLNVFNDYNEEEGILHFAAGVNADMVALSTHGRRGLAHLLSGSIAEDVVNHSNRPVMTYVIGEAATKSKVKSKMAIDSLA